MDDSILYDIKGYSTWTNETDLNKVFLFYLTLEELTVEFYFNKKDIIAQIRQKKSQANYCMLKINKGDLELNILKYSSFLDYISKFGSYLKSFIKSDLTTFKLLLPSIKPWNQWKLAISK